MHPEDGPETKRSRASDAADAAGEFPLPAADEVDDDLEEAADQPETKRARVMSEPTIYGEDPDAPEAEVGAVLMEVGLVDHFNCEDVEKTHFKPTQHLASVSRGSAKPLISERPISGKAGNALRNGAREV